MSDTPSPTDRIARLEIRLTEQEAVIEDLNAAITEQWRVIDRLSTDLKQLFPGAAGFSSRNLKYMRAFAAAWPDLGVVQQPVAQLPWSHHVILLDKLDERA